jgi:CRP-like cAMP-binding protein
MVSWAGDWIYGVALAVFVYDATSSPSWVAATTVARMLPYLLLSPFAGVLADRFPKVRILVASELAAAWLMAGITVVSVVHGPVLLAVVLATATATAGTARGPAFQAMLPEVVDEDDLPGANTLVSVVENLAVTSGPAVAVALLVTIGPTGAFAVNTVTFLVSAALVSGLRGYARTATAPEVDVASILRRLREGLAAAVGSASTRACIGFAMLSYFLYGVDTVAFVIISTQHLALGSDGLGYLFAALGLGGLLVVPLINRLSSSARLMLVLTAATVAYCLPGAGLALVGQPVLAVGLIVVRGAAFVVIDVLTITAMQRLVPAAVLGRVFAVYASLVVGGALLGAAVVAPVVSLAGLNGALLAFGLVPAAGVLLTYPWLRGLDEQTARRRGQLAPAVAAFRGVAMLSSAPRSTLERLAAGATLDEVAADTVVVYEGDIANAFYVVVDGRLGVASTGGTGGTPIVLGDLGPDDCFGEIGLVHGRPRTATVTTHTTCRLYRVPGDDFLGAVSASSAWGPAVFDLAKTRLVRSHGRQNGRGAPGTGIQDPGSDETSAAPDRPEDHR